MEKSYALIISPKGPIRTGLQAILSVISEIETLKPVADTATALEVIALRQPKLIILSGAFTVDEQLTALRQLKARCPQAHYLVITRCPQQRDALESNGADAVLIEGTSAALLFSVIKGLLVSPKRVQLDQTDYFQRKEQDDE